MLHPRRLVNSKALYRELRRWRRERDSNPRYDFSHTRFPIVHLQPLGHLSKSGRAASLESVPRLEVAESKGFEPLVPLPVLLISNQAPSTARPALRGRN